MAIRTDDGDLTALGRGVVVRPGQMPPEAWQAVPRIVVDQTTMQTKATVDQLHRHWVARSPVVVELGTSAERLGVPQTMDDPPHTLAGDFEFLQERAEFLVWANNYDLRNSQMLWPHLTRAEKNGLRPGGPADALVGSQPVWIDGGPREPVQTRHASIHWESIVAGSSALARPPIDPDDELAPDQLAAVAHLRGAARVIAPAGSGKTRVLVARLRHLIEDRHIERGSVTAVVYNVRARQELDERAGDLKANIRTIHSLGFWICRLAEPRLQVIEEDRQRAILRRYVDPPREYNTDPYAPYIEALSRVRTGLVKPAALEGARDDVPGFTVAFAQYQQELRSRGVIDFDDQIYRAIEHLLTNPELRAKVQATARHLLIDEFQDLTPGYLLLLRLVAAPEYQVFGVGDDDQVIYGYAGATPEYLIGYDQLFPGAAHHPLEVNYRCPPEVVAKATNLLAHNRKRVPKTIKATPDRPKVSGSLQILRMGDDAGSTAVARQIRAWLDRGAEPSDIAVLHRVNTGLLPFQTALARMDIPYISPLEATLLQRTGVRALLAWMRIATDTEAISTDDIVEVLKRRPKRMSKVAVQHIAAGAVCNLEQLDERASTFNVDNYRRIASAFVSEVRHLAQEASSGDTASVIRAIRAKTGLDRSTDQLDRSRQAEGSGGHGDALDAIEQVATQHDNPATFEAFLRTTLTSARPRNAVLLSSIHRVKGREWKHVVVAGAKDEVMPHKLADDMEEERRVFHVAITRAMETCYIVADRERPSPFIQELDSPMPQQHPPAVHDAPAPTTHRARKGDDQHQEAERILKMIPKAPADPLDIGTGTIQRLGKLVVYRPAAGGRFRVDEGAFVGAYADWIGKGRPGNPRQVGYLQDERAPRFAAMARSLIAAVAPEAAGEPSSATGSVPDLAKRLFGINVKSSTGRFKDDGWISEGPVGVPCPICGQSHLEILRKPYETTHGKYRYWAIVCTRCATAHAPDTIDVDTMKAIKKVST